MRDQEAHCSRDPDPVTRPRISPVPMPIVLFVLVSPSVWASLRMHKNKSGRVKGKGHRVNVYYLIRVRNTFSDQKQEKHSLD